MRYGIANQPRETEVMTRRAQLAESHGFDFFGLTDSQSLLRETYTTMGAVAAATDRIEVGPSVTNPVTRHPVVTASALCTIDEYTDGCAALGVGGGDSAVRTVGETPASLPELVEFIRTFRALCRGEEVEHDGYPVQLEWLPQKGETHEVPILLAAGGPRTLRAAGEFADRVLISWGVNPAELEAAVEHVDEGVRRAGRSPDEVEKWVHAWARFDDPSYVDGELADDLTKSELAACAHLNFQFGTEGKNVPTEYEGRLMELVSGYNSHDHMGLAEDEARSRRDANRRLVEDLELTDYLLSRFTVSGDETRCEETLRSIDGIGAIDGVLFNPIADTATVDPRHMEEFVSKMGEDVIPAV